MSVVLVGRILALLALVWTAANLLIPWLREASWAFWAGLFLIASAFLVSVWAILRRGKVLVAPALAQLALFCLVSYQLSAIYGPGHFRHEREPRWYDWVGLITAHLLRAADLADVLDGYGIKLQPVRNQSPAASWLLASLHLAVGTFLIGAALSWASRSWRRRTARRGREMRGQEQTIDDWIALENREHRQRLGQALRRLLKKLAIVGVIGCLAAYLIWAYAQGWSGRDWILWPVDHALRTVDIADLFQLFDMRMHGVEEGFWLATLAVAFQLFLGICLADLLLGARIKWLAGAGLSVEEQVLALAAQSSGDLSSAGDPETREQIRSLVRRYGAGEIVPVLLDIVDHGQSEMRGREILLEAALESQEALPALIRALKAHNRQVRVVAAEVLARLGPGAKEAAPALANTLIDAVTASHQPDVQAWVKVNEEMVVYGCVQALVALSPVCPEVLVVLDQHQPDWRKSESAAQAAPMLVEVMTTSTGEVRQRAENVFAQIDPALREMVLAARQNG